MSEIEDRLRAAMRAAVGNEELPSHLLGLVMRRQRRRHAFVMAIAVLVALAVAIPGAIAVHGALALRPPSTHRHGTTPPKRLPAKLTGQPWPTGTDLQLLVRAQSGAGWFSTATGRVEPIAGLPPTGVLGFYRIDGGWVAEQLHGGWQCPPTCDEPQYFIADGSVAARRIGSGFPTKASDRSGAVWLDILPPGTHDSYTTPTSAQLVTTAGRPVGPR